MNDHIPRINKQELLIEILNKLFIKYARTYNKLIDICTDNHSTQIRYKQKTYNRYWLSNLTEISVNNLESDYTVPEIYEKDFQYYSSIMELLDVTSFILKDIISFCVTKNDFEQLLPYEIFSIIEEYFSKPDVSYSYPHSQEHLDLFKKIRKENYDTLHNILTKLMLLNSD